MTQVWPLPLPHADKLVLLALADNANDEGYCYPSAVTLSRKCGMDERTVRRAIKRLQEDGHLTERPRPGRSSTYFIHPGQIARTTAGTAPGPNETNNLAAPNTQPRTERPDTPGTAPPGTESGGAGTAPGPVRAQCPDTPGTAPDITVREPSVEPSLDRAAARAKRSPDTATRFPDGFELTAERRAVAVAEHLDPDREFTNFRDHFRAASGARARKHDWDAAWRIWCRRAPDMQPQRAGARSRMQPDEQTRLRKFVDGKSAMGLADFRGPLPDETADSYWRALDAEHKRRAVERERLRPPGVSRDPPGSRAPP